MTLRTSNLIRFTPGPHDAEADDPTARFTLALATRLDGVTQWSATSGEGLRALLEIAFAPSGGLCDRAHLVGVTPAGHAPLVLTKAGYWGSTCGYSNPSTDVFWVYSDASGDGETLVIDTPCENLYGCFHWPSAVVTYDPPLEEGETAPTVTLQLDGFVGLDGDTETGVRLPMRLILKKVGVTGETELAVLNYEDAPHFTGSGTSIAVKKAQGGPDPDGPGLFKLTGRALADAVNHVTGDYEIYWRIYHGSGDMLYTASCSVPDDPATPDNEAHSATLPETVTDRRNAGIGGGFGLWATTDLKVGTIRVEKEPWPFWLTMGQLVGASRVNYEYDLRDTTVRVPDKSRAGFVFEKDWVGAVDGEPVALCWLTDGIYCAGRRLVSSSYPVLAAALRELPALQGDPPGWGLVWLARASWSADYSLRVFVRRLAVNAVTRLVMTVPGIRRNTNARAHFSASGQQACVFYPPGLPNAVDNDLGTFQNGALYTLDLADLTTPASLDPALTPGNAPSVLSASVSVAPSAFSYSYHATIDCLYDARYVGETLTPEQFALALSVEDSGLTQALPSSQQGSDVSEESLCSGSEQGTLDPEPTLIYTVTGGHEDVYAYDRTLSVNGLCGVRMQSAGSAQYPQTANWMRRRLAKTDGSICWGEGQFYFVEQAPIGSITIPLVSESRGIKLVPQGRSGPVSICSSYLSKPFPEPVEKSIRVTDTAGRLLLDAPDEDDERARDWHFPWDVTDVQIIDNDSALLALKRAMCHNLRNVLMRPSTVQSTTWVGLDTKSVLAPDGDSRLTVLKWDHNDLAGAIPPYRSRYAVASGSSQTDIDFDDYLLDGLGVLTPRACLLAPNQTSVKPETGGCTGGTTPTGPTPSEAELIAAHNQFRAAHGLGALAQNAQLSAAIAGHLAWLKAENSGISHTGDGGSQPLDRAISAGYEGAGSTSVGENLALGYTTVALVMAAWENSPAHYANLVHADWSDIGVAILPIADDDPGFWWGALFGDRT